MLVFDEATHTYTVDGVVVPSVTQILSGACLYDFSMVAPDVLERKRQIGTAVHKAIELSLAGDLDEDWLPAAWAGYFRAWQKFVADTGITDADIGPGEGPMYHTGFRYAGTPDRQIYLDKRWAVLDLKTTAELHPAVGLQLAAYQELINDSPANDMPHTLQIKDRYALQLKENGTYRLEQYKDKSDWQVFLSLLTVANWKRKNAK